MAYTEGAAPIALDSAVTLIDVDLAALNGGAGNDTIDGGAGIDTIDVNTRTLSAETFRIYTRDAAIAAGAKVVAAKPLKRQIWRNPKPIILSPLVVAPVPLREILIFNPKPQ